MMGFLKKMIVPPWRDVFLIVAVSALLTEDVLRHDDHVMLWFVAIVGALPVMGAAIRSLIDRRLSIDVFNAFAVGVSFATGEVRSASFIVLMLAFASILEWRTSSRQSRAIEALLALKPDRALRTATDGTLEDIPAEDVRKGDVLLVKTGERIPVDGIVNFGMGSLNEASVTGESKPVEKILGDMVFASTLNEGAPIKIMATRVGKDSTIDRMIVLVGEARKNKSAPERLADVFAGYFLPVTLVAGTVTFALTHDLSMVAALFLVACADDMAVAIPLAVSAALGHAARRGVLVKGGERLSLLSRVDTVVFDKTGTLTLGTFEVEEVSRESWISEGDFWRFLGAAEKFSEHPVGRAIFRRVVEENVGNIPDPEATEVKKGKGVVVRLDGKTAAVGNQQLFEEVFPQADRSIVERYAEQFRTGDVLAIDGKIAGFVRVADAPRPESKQSIDRLRELGVSRIVMMTGDDEETAHRVAASLGIAQVFANMTPESKLRAVEALSQKGTLAMVGDGVNDAPALARADIGVAMGAGGTAVAVESADIVILSDDLSRLPEMIELGRQTRSVIFGDMGIWFVTNVFGFVLVFVSILGPSLAALYNFLTDFLPILNSARLFRRQKTGIVDR